MLHFSSREDERNKHQQHLMPNTSTTYRPLCPYWWLSILYIHENSITSVLLVVIEKHQQHLMPNTSTTYRPLCPYWWLSKGITPIHPIRKSIACGPTGRYRIHAKAYTRSYWWLSKIPPIHNSSVYALLVVIENNR
jgi:hypothetical protein